MTTSWESMAERIEERAPIVKKECLDYDRQLTLATQAMDDENIDQLQPESVEGYTGAYATE